MKTILRYLVFVVIGYSLGVLGSLVDLSKQRDRALEFIGANPPGKEFNGLEPILGTPSEIQAKLDSLAGPGGRGMTESERRDELFMRDAFGWLKGDADERIRRVRGLGRLCAIMGLTLLGVSFLSSRRARNNPNHTLQPTAAR